MRLTKKLHYGGAGAGAGEGEGTREGVLVRNSLENPIRYAQVNIESIIY